jgi:hypothetical protein
MLEVCVHERVSRFKSFERTISVKGYVQRPNFCERPDPQRGRSQALKVYEGKSTVSMNGIVLITGASTGFGRAAAETPARRGYTVFATMRESSGRNAANSEALESLASREHWALHVLDLEVTNDTSVQQAVHRPSTEPDTSTWLSILPELPPWVSPKPTRSRNSSNCSTSTFLEPFASIAPCCPRCVDNEADC